MKSPQKHILRELSAKEMPRIYPLLKQLNPKLSKAQFNARLKSMLAQEYRCLGAFDGTTLVGICGFRIFSRFWCGSQMDLDNFVIEKTLRGAGLGERMLRWLEALAEKEKVETMVLDSYATSHDTHRFYYRHGYYVKGYHFIKPLVSGPMTGPAVKRIYRKN